MNQSAIGWIALAIAVVVFLDLLYVEVRRAAREGLRIARRVGGYADLPVIALAANVGDDIEQIVRALDEVPLLLARARIAVETIRYPRGRPSAPFVPNGSDASNGYSAESASPSA